jgi:hypothetical protein
MIWINQNGAACPLWVKSGLSASQQNDILIGSGNELAENSQRQPVHA